MARITGYPPEFHLARLAKEAQRDRVRGVTVRGLLDDEGRILLLRRAARDPTGGDIYDLPGGQARWKREGVGAALKRQFHSKTGINVAVISGYLGSHDHLSGSGKRYRQLNFVVEAKAITPIKLNRLEHDAYVWASRFDLRHLQVAERAGYAIRVHLNRRGR